MVPENEEKRLEALINYNILDTPEEDEYNEIVKLASFLCNTPIALISFIDGERQWFKAKVGFNTKEIKRETTICQYTILEKGILKIEDASEDPKFKNHPLVVGGPLLRFYAGVPLVDEGGYNIGTICVFDNKPRELTEEQLEALKILGKSVITLLQLRRINKELESKNKKIETAFDVLEQSEQKFKFITESITDVFYLYNIIEKRYEYISPNCFNLCGKKPEYFYEGNSMNTFVIPEDLAGVLESDASVELGMPCDIEYRTRIGEQLKWVSEKSFPVFGKSGKPVMNSGILRDISLRKKNEKIIAEKTKSISESIEYASSIQQAILAPKEEMVKKLGDFFILSKPKDVVGGDFYFYKEIINGYILALGDCTGHGVPGGFMSMLGNALLNEIISKNEEVSPAKILEKLKRRIIKLLNQSTTYASNKDGMDIALLAFDNRDKSVQYAGANIPLYLFQNKEMKMILADKSHIGINIGLSDTEFTNHKIELKKGDSIYLSSDGYADQFGGPIGKRYSKAQFRTLLSEIHDKKIAEQENILNQTILNWKGHMEQVDDIMIIGMVI